MSEIEELIKYLDSDEGERKYLTWVGWYDCTPQYCSGRVWTNREKAVIEFGAPAVEKLEQIEDVGVQMVSSLGEIYVIHSLADPACPEQEVAQ